MKIVMFTPGLRTSAIGRMACIVVRELVAKQVDVVVVRCEQPHHLSRPAHPFGVRTLDWTDDEAVAEACTQADMVVYHVGDNYDFHSGAVAWLTRSPGVVCLHDFYLGHLLLGWASMHRAEAEQALRQWYGEGADVRFFKASRAHTFIAKTAADLPCTEWLCSMASAVVTHSSWGIDRVLASCPGPVRVVPLAYEALPIAAAIPDHVPNSDQFRVLTIGHANPNKRMASVIQAIGGSPYLRERTVYRHVGHASPTTAMDLAALAGGMGVDFVSSGELDDDALNDAFAWADVVSCLRMPSLEAASASAIESMLHGKAIIVSDGGFYSEIPDDCASRVERNDEVVSLRKILERLAANPSERVIQGSRAREWALSTFRADDYAHDLMAMRGESDLVAPIARAANYFVDTLAQWGGSARWLAEPDVIEPMVIFGDVARLPAGSPRS